MPKKANLGLATTGQLLEEVHARLRVDGQLDRRTVNDDQPTGQPAEAHVRELLEDEDGAPLTEAMQQAWNAVRDIATTVAQVQARRYRAAADAVMAGAAAGEPKAGDMRSELEGRPRTPLVDCCDGEPHEAHTPAGDELIAADVELEQERDKAQRDRDTYLRQLDRAQARMTQQDRQLYEARQRDKANVTRWRDAEERLGRVMRQRDRLNEHARDLQQRLDTAQPDMINANQQLRIELEQVIRERDLLKSDLAERIAVSLAQLAPL